jgi:hypothetical protein
MSKGKLQFCRRKVKQAGEQRVKLTRTAKRTRLSTVDNQDEKAEENYQKPEPITN